jgi:hypothetical protein
MAVEQTVLVIEADGFAVLENPAPAIAKPVFDVGSDDQVHVAPAIVPRARA